MKKYINKQERHRADILRTVKESSHTMYNEDLIQC